MRRILAFIAALLPISASASPWTLKPGEVVVGTGFGYQFAGTEFLDSGGERPYPLQGDYRASSIYLSARAGFTDRLEFELSLPFSVVSYDSDTVILLDGGAAGTIDYYQENTIQLDRTVAGLGDLLLTGRYRLGPRGPTAWALEVRLKTPTGYRGPQGTFGERPESIQEFLDGIGNFVRPDNVSDDVVLGDGQLDIYPSLLFGHAFRNGTFLRLNAGYNFRFSGAGDQVGGAFRVGQRLGDRFLAYLAVQGAYSLERGRVIGVSVAAIDPLLPATEYGGTNNLLLREVRLDRDNLDVGGGFIFKYSPSVELNVGYQRTVFGRNISAVNGLSFTVAWQTNLDG